MTTLDRLDLAKANADTLHAALIGFALETLEPTGKAMWNELARSSQQIAASIASRRSQLLQREETILAATNNIQAAHDAISDMTKMTDA